MSDTMARNKHGDLLIQPLNITKIYAVFHERDGGWYPRTVSQKYGGIHTYLGRFPWGSSTMQHFEMHKTTAPNLTLSVQNRRWGRWSESSFFRINHPCKHSYVYIYIYAYKYYPEWRGPCFLPPFIRMLAQARCTTRCMSAFILCSTSEDGLPEGLQLTTQTCAHVNTYEDTPVRDVWINA